MRAALVSLLLAASLATCAPAHARMLCGPVAAVTEVLEHAGETPIGGGLNARAAILVFVAPGGATFTIVAVDPTGVACILAGGRDWDVGDVPPAGEES